MRLLVILVVAILLNRLLKVLTTRLVVLAKSQTRIAQMREQQTRTLASFLYSAGTIVIIAVAILLALPEFGFDVTPVELSAGLASLALGFGGQYLVRDLINGFFIVFEDQFAVGDTISLNNEIGQVEHVTLRRTIIRNPQGAMVSIPNGQIGQVANLSRDWSQYFLDVTVPTDGTVGRGLELLDKIAGELRSDATWSAILMDGPRVLGLEALSLSGMTLRIQFRSAPNRQDDVARELRRRIKLEFEQNRVPFIGVQRIELAEEGRPAR